jgi:hypothetical protein
MYGFQFHPGESRDTKCHLIRSDRLLRCTLRPIRDSSDSNALAGGGDSWENPRSRPEGIELKNGSDLIVASLSH